METPPLRFFTTSDGYRIAYFDVGVGQPFVFMPHPFSDVEAMWSEPSIVQPWLHGLSQRFRLIAFDGRGMGASTRGLPQQVTMADFDRDVEELVDALHLREFLLLGMGYSGISGIRYAAAHPGSRSGTHSGGQQRTHGCPLTRDVSRVPGSGLGVLLVQEHPSRSSDG